MRPDNDQYFMSIAHQVATRSTCDRAHVGVVIVRPDNTICSTGYNGSARGQAHCDDVGHLIKNGHCIRALHAEGNALDWAQEQLTGYTLYTTHYPCWQCALRIVNRGLRRVVYGQDYRNGDDVAKMLREAGVDLARCEVVPGPILHIYQDGDEYFASLPSFVDLQESEVAWLDDDVAKQLYFLYGELCVKFRDAQAKKLGWAQE